MSYIRYPKIYQADNPIPRKAALTPASSGFGSPDLEGCESFAVLNHIRLVVAERPGSTIEQDNIIGVVRDLLPSAQVVFIAPHDQRQVSEEVSRVQGEPVEKPGRLFEPPAYRAARVSDMALESEKSQQIREENRMRFTPRQVQVVRGLVRGLSNKEIARELGLAESTVKVHVISVLRACKVHSRAGAVSAVLSSPALRAQFGL